VADGQEVGFPPSTTNLEDREMSKLNHTDTPAAAEYATVYVAFELSKANWHLGVILPGSQKLSRFRIDGGDLAALSVHLAKWRAKAATAGKPVRIVSCYEAGYDGHWLHRWLTNQGVINYEIDPGEHSGQPSRAAAEDGSDRSGAADEHAAALPARRAAGVQHGASALAGG
jgi:transposase